MSRTYPFECPKSVLLENFYFNPIECFFFPKGGSSFSVNLMSKCTRQRFLRAVVTRPTCIGLFPFHSDLLFMFFACCSEKAQHPIISHLKVIL